MDFHLIQKRENIILTAPGIATLVIIAHYFTLAGHGIDVTDESFYILSISFPSQWTAIVPTSFFGHVYHPIAYILGYDLQALRAWNFVITVVISIFSIQIIIKNTLLKIGQDRYFLLLISIVLSAITLCSFNLGMLTPNYNSLAFQGLLVALIGLIWCTKAETITGTLGIIFLSVGGLLASLAKPTSGILLAFAVLISAAIFDKNHFKKLLVAGLLSAFLLLAFVYIVDGSLLNFANRLRTSLDLLQTLGSGQSFNKIFRIDLLGLNYPHYLAAAFLSGLVYLLARLGSSSNTKFKMAYYLLIVTFSVGAVYVGLGGYANELPLKFSKPIFFLFSTFNLLFIFTISNSVLRFIKSPKSIFLTILLLSFPHIYAFGTNANYWFNGAHAALFWVLSCFVPLSYVEPLNLRVKFAVALATVTLFISSFFINHAITQPYRQSESLRGYAKEVQFGPSGKVSVSNDFYKYFSEVLKTADTANFKKNTPMIDLTGQSPGILYLINAKPLGQPWLVGAYPGSDELAVTSLALEECSTLAEAWLLAETDGPRSLNASKVLRSYGADMSLDYQAIGTFSTAPYTGGYAEVRDQTLLKPLRSTLEATQSCLETR